MLKGKAEWTDRPKPESGFLWQAFHHLRGSRNFGGAIPFSEIARYADEVGITCPVMRGRLVDVIISLDNAERSPNGTAA